MNKQIQSGVTIREELKEWGCAYSREYGVHVWRDSKGTLVAKGLGLADTTREAHSIMAKRIDAQKEAQSNQDATEGSEAPAKQWNEMTDDEQRNAALQGDLYELVGLGLASPDLLEQSALVDVPDILAENRKRIELLEKQVAKLQGDLDAAGNIIIAAGQQVEKKSRMALDLAEKNASLKVAMRDVIGRMNESLVFNEGTSAIALKRMREVLAKAIVESEESASTEAPATKPIAARMHVNWSGRGFSSGDYEVLGHSASK